MKKKLFAVYGTLKENYHNNYLLEKATLKGEHQTAPAFTMYSMGGFPAVVPEGNTTIHLEIFETDDKQTIDTINRLEGYSGVRGSQSNWYDTVDIETPWGTAEMFIFNNAPNQSMVESGKW